MSFYYMHACAGRQFWPCRLVGDLNIYIPYKFEWIWAKNKKVVLHVFMCKISNATARACMHYFRSEQMLEYHAGKFHIDPLNSSWEHSRTKKYQRRRRNRVKTTGSQLSFGKHNNYILIQGIFDNLKIHLLHFLNNWQKINVFVLNYFLK
jgi:hypothetical protein